jgi:hypothetical protein
MPPQLVADVVLYATADNGRAFAAPPGWGCPCMVSSEPPWNGWDGWPLLDKHAIEPGDSRRLGFVFLSPEAAEIFRAAGQFYLWEGRIIGEAKVVG